MPISLERPLWELLIVPGAMWPVAVIAANVRLGTAAVSYAGHLRCSVQYDSATIPGETFARATRAELKRLGG